METGAAFTLDRDETPGNARRVNLPHPEIYAALVPETRLLLDDGKLVLRVKAIGEDRIDTIVEVGGVPEVATAFGIADTTVRTHVTRLFEKTGTSRQADLVKLVAGYATPLADGAA